MHLDMTKKKLGNGLRYILAPMKGTEAVTVMVLVGTGSMYESKKENGLAHFIEHMCFKGTAKRPSSDILSEEFDSIGARNNAFTGNHATGYWAKAHKKHASHILDIVADLYKDPLFPQAEIEKEKGVVIQEINMYEDSPQHKVFQVLDRLMYGDQPAGRDIAGTKETVSAFTRGHILKYHKRNYTTANTVVVVAGNIDRKKIDKDIRAAFGGIKRSPKPRLGKVSFSQTAPRAAQFDKKTDQTHLAIAFPAFDMFDKRVPAGYAFRSVLSSGMSSRLFKKMRNELGVCYYVRADLSAGIDAGAFCVSAGVANDRVEEAVKAIAAELKKMKSELVTPKELRKVKDMKLSGLVLGLETSSDIADYCAFQELYKNKIESPGEASRKIEKTTAKEVQAVANDICAGKKGNIALVGPKRDLRPLIKILRGI